MAGANRLHWHLGAAVGQNHSPSPELWDRSALNPSQKSEEWNSLQGHQLPLPGGGQHCCHRGLAGRSDRESGRNVLYLVLWLLFYINCMD